MTDERYKELQSGESDRLTSDELNEGWRFCNDCDGLLINKNTQDCPCVKGVDWCQLNKQGLDKPLTEW